MGCGSDRGMSLENRNLVEKYIVYMLCDSVCWDVGVGGGGGFGCHFRRREQDIFLVHKYYISTVLYMISLIDLFIYLSILHKVKSKYI